MSGAEPWIGSYRPRGFPKEFIPSPSEAEGKLPIEPVSTEASSVRISPNRLPVRMTSNEAARVKRCMAAASTNRCSRLISGYSRATRLTTCRQRRELSKTCFSAQAGLAKIHITRQLAYHQQIDTFQMLRLEWRSAHQVWVWLDRP